MLRTVGDLLYTRGCKLLLYHLRFLSLAYLG